MGSLFVQHSHGLNLSLKKSTQPVKTGFVVQGHVNEYITWNQELNMCLFVYYFSFHK